MRIPTREEVIRMRELYPPGTRIRLMGMEDPYAPIEQGTMKEQIKL